MKLGLCLESKRFGGYFVQLLLYKNAVKIIRMLNPLWFYIFKSDEMHDLQNHNVINHGKWWLRCEHFSKNQYTLYAPHQSEINELEPESSFSFIIHIWQKPQNNIETFLVLFPLFICLHFGLQLLSYIEGQFDRSRQPFRFLSAFLIRLSLYSLIFDSLSFYHSSTLGSGVKHFPSNNEIPKFFFFASPF